MIIPEQHWMAWAVAEMVAADRLWIGKFYRKRAKVFGSDVWHVPEADE